MLQAVININSLMRRSLCDKLHGGRSHLLIAHCSSHRSAIRPEYCSPVWSPVSVSLINQLESVQRRFTKRVPVLRSLTYDERCARLGINRLELRRLHADLTLCYKIIHGLVLLYCDKFFTRPFAQIICSRIESKL